jgi:hypothetical protein
MDESNLNYSELEETLTLPIDGEVITNINVTPGNQLDGPYLGRTVNHIYIFWSILRQTGLEAGTAITEFLVFPKGKTNQIETGLVTVYPMSEDRFQPYSGDLALSQIITKPTANYLSTNFVYDPQSNSSKNNTLVVAVAASQSIRLDSYIQIIINIFSDGEYLGYIMPTRTTQISERPHVTIDNHGQIHLVWQDGTTGRQVFYTTTNPEIRSRFDKVTISDLPDLILTGGLEAITGILLFPFAFPWMAVGFVLLVIWRLMRNDEDITYPVSRILLGISLLAYQVSKLLFLPDILVYVPFSAWIDIPAGMNSFLKIAVPLIIFGFGFVVAEWFRRKRLSPPSALGYYFLVILVDTILTLAIYGVIFLGEY